MEGFIDRLGDITAAEGFHPVQADLYLTQPRLKRNDPGQELLEIVFIKNHAEPKPFKPGGFRL